MTPAPDPLDMAGVERLERAARGERLDRIYGAGRAPTLQHSADLTALLSAFEEQGGALGEIANLPNLSKGPVDDFERGARAARLDAADIAARALSPTVKG